MTNEILSGILSGLIRSNLAGAAATAAVLLVRLPARRLLGPETAYRLWAAVPFAMAACLLPARTVMGAVQRKLPPALELHAGHLLAIWIVGLVACAALLVRAQLAFDRSIRKGQAGPAVVGVVAPRLIMPPDDGRYTPAERELIRAHERAHMERQDPRASALAAALQTLAWFNPLIHLGARAMRLDQELACDATVLRRRPAMRALYARTLLKTQLAARPLPLGCYWPARGRHPLEVRVALLKPKAQMDGLLGGGLVAAAVLLAGSLAWAAQPPIPRVLLANPAAYEAPQPAMSVMILRAAPAARR